MAEPRTHRERAKRAAELIDRLEGTRAYPSDLSPIIAKHTYPAELVRAARKALNEISEAAEATQKQYLFDLQDELEIFLALYPTEKETPE